MQDEPYPRPVCRCGECRRCKQRAYQKRYYQRNKEVSKERSRAWNRAHKEATAAIRQRWMDRHPEKVAAHIVFRKAIYDGVVTRQPCEICGCPDADGHHDDYSRPLDVRWLCRVHHVLLHRSKERTARRRMDARGAGYE